MFQRARKNFKQTSPREKPPNILLQISRKEVRSSNMSKKDNISAIELSYRIGENFVGLGFLKKLLGCREINADFGNRSISTVNTFVVCY